MAKRQRVRRPKGRQPRHGKLSVNGTSTQQFVKTSFGPNREITKQYHESTGNTLFRDRAGSIHINQRRTPEMLAFWEARYPTMKYSRRELKERGMPDEYGIITNNPVPRGEALRLADKLLAETDITMHIRIVKGPSVNADLFFNAKKTKWYVLETNLDLRVIRKSGTYPYDTMARAAYISKRIMWVETIIIPPE